VENRKTERKDKQNMRKRSPIIIPLDGMTEKTALDTASRLSGSVWGFKINDLLLECGVSVIAKLRKYGLVFADPKLHDIPNSVANSMAKLSAAGANFVTVHASGGVEMMRAAVNAAGGSWVLAVTVLTSLDESTAHLIFGNPVKATVLQFARNAMLAGVEGVVCSPKELEVLGSQPELRTLIRVTPGIRPSWYQVSDDQRRKMTPAEAVKLGANLLVIGRPILRSDDPMEAVEKTLQEIDEAVAV